jgi:hypothetical protein
MEVTGYYESQWLLCEKLVAIGSHLWLWKYMVAMVAMEINDCYLSQIALESQ